MRLFSLVVSGFERHADGNPHEHINERRIRIVAETNAEAIETARNLLDPDHSFPDKNWAVIDGFELAPESTDPANSAASWKKGRSNG